MASKFPLSKEEIQKLVTSLKRIFKATENERIFEALANHIQYPKIPSLLSESVAYHLLKDKKILFELNISEIKQDHSIADICIKTSEGDKKVEVKSTGKSAFQEFGKKDIQADYLLWLHFDTLFSDQSINTFEVFILKNPAQYFQKPLKITLSGLKKCIPDLQAIPFEINKL